MLEPLLSAVRMSDRLLMAFKAQFWELPWDLSTPNCPAAEQIALSSMPYSPIKEFSWLHCNLLFMTYLSSQGQGEVLHFPLQSLEQNGPPAFRSLRRDWGSQYDGKSSSVLKKHQGADGSFDSGSVALTVSSFVSHLGTEKMYPQSSAFTHSSVTQRLDPWAFQVGRPNFCAQQTRPPSTAATSLGSPCYQRRAELHYTPTWRVFHQRTNERAPNRAVYFFLFFLGGGCGRALLCFYRQTL